MIQLFPSPGLQQQQQKPTFHGRETRAKICTLRAAKIAFGEESEKIFQIVV
jgi:hypothetical protein